jgi:hypothetical protein
MIHPIDDDQRKILHNNVYDFLAKQGVERKDIWICGPDSIYDETVETPNVCHPEMEVVDGTDKQVNRCIHCKFMWDVGDFDQV